MPVDDARLDKYEEAKEPLSENEDKAGGAAVMIQNDYNAYKNINKVLNSAQRTFACRKDSSLVHDTRKQEFEKIDDE